MSSRQAKTFQQSKKITSDSMEAASCSEISKQPKDDMRREQSYELVALTETLHEYSARIRIILGEHQTAETSASKAAPRRPNRTQEKPKKSNRAPLPRGVESKTARGASLQRIGEEVRALQRGLTGERLLAGSSYFSSYEFLEAYLSYYWPVSFVETYLALMELEARSIKIPGTHVLDLGAGPGPATFACLEFFRNFVRDDKKEQPLVTLVDKNATALEVSKRIAALSDDDSRKQGLAPNLRCILCDLQSFAGKNMTKSGLQESAPSKEFEDVGSQEDGAFQNSASYSLILMCHCLNELWKDEPEAEAVEKRFMLVLEACRHLEDGGLLLIVEPAAAIASRPALMLRDRLLAYTATAGGADASSAADGGFVLRCAAPCPGSFPCPAIAAIPTTAIAAAGAQSAKQALQSQQGAADAQPQRSCHSRWPWNLRGELAEIASEAGLDRDSAKATWFALQKCALPNSDLQPTTNQRSGAALNRAQLYGRVISEPLLNKAGRIRYLFCTASGLATVSARADDEYPKKIGFFTLERGDLVKLSDLEIRPGERNFGIQKSSQLSVVFKIPRIN